MTDNMKKGVFHVIGKEHIANAVTISRIIFALMMLPFKTFSAPFYILYVICGSTDMVDGFIARKTHSESEIGAKLDSIADMIFVAVSLIKILPVIEIKMWLWIWIAVTVVIKVINIVSGYVYRNKLVLPHTLANKITGLLCFILPLTLIFIDIHTAAIPVCVAATFAAVQEGHFIRTGRE